MCEAELHILKRRMVEGRLNKARRGELFYHVPIGYVKQPSGQVVLDPDEQVQFVVRLAFEKFEELGAVSRVLDYFVEHGFRLGIRPHDGPNRGNLEWRRPNRATLTEMLHHPIYTGAYSFGRCQVDPRLKREGRSAGRRRVPMEQWHALQQQRLPAYISWDQYLANQRQLEQNRARIAFMGAPREGPSLMSGLLICAKCGSRMLVNYNGRVRAHRYVCHRQRMDYGEETCQTLAGKVVDDLVSQQVLQVLEPAALQLSLQAVDDVERERERQDRHWRLQLERAGYDADRAFRQYDAVDPTNRLVARELERRWNDALQEQRRIEEGFQRFQRERPSELTAEERTRIEALATDIPGLWHSPTTSTLDRQQIVRFLIERVVVNVQNRSEFVDMTIHWSGGFTSQHETIRSVGKYEQLRDFPELKRRIMELADEGRTATEIAEQLNRDGFRPAKRRKKFNRTTVRQLLYRFGRIGPCNRPGLEHGALATDEWWLSDLAKEVAIPQSTIHSWLKRGWLHARREQEQTGRWICWADAEELDRLRRLYASPRGHSIEQPYSPKLTTPKPRPTKKRGRTPEV